MGYRIEKDTLGEIKVSDDKLWGAHTQRSFENFRIGPDGSMPYEVIEAYAFIKKAAAIVNCNHGFLSSEKKDLIIDVCDEIISGKLCSHFPLVIWQTGSGTHTNMNCNEVIAHRAQQLLKLDLVNEPLFVHPIDDVNKSQSSNDTFSTAMHIAAYKKVKSDLIPAIVQLYESLYQKSQDFTEIVKIGRTHFMDAVPITLGQEFSGYAFQINCGLNSLQDSLLKLGELPIGGTAVGTGLNTFQNYDMEMSAQIKEFTGFPFSSGTNKYALQAGHEAILRTHCAIKQLAVSILKIVNDIRVMSSGPRAGFAELILPANEAGSSIMPGKVNPTQIEALSMVCTQIIGNDVTISMACSSGHFELNVYKPLIIANFLYSASLLTDAVISFNKNCLLGLSADLNKIKYYLENSLMLITAITPHIGYDNAALISKKAFKENISLKKAAIDLGLLTSQQFDKWIVPGDMTKPNL